MEYSPPKLRVILAAEDMEPCKVPLQIWLPFTVNQHTPFKAIREIDYVGAISVYSSTYTQNSIVLLHANFS